MSIGYKPKERTLTTEYIVPTTGDRFFVPVNAPDATMSNQLAECQKVIGTGKDDAVVASERLAS